MTMYIESILLSFSLMSQDFDNDEDAVLQQVLNQSLQDR